MQSKMKTKINIILQKRENKHKKKKLEKKNQKGYLTFTYHIGGSHLDSSHTLRVNNF